MPKRSRELKPLTSEHEQALLLAFQLKKGLAGHSESAGAPKDLPGLLAFARRYETQVLLPHTRAEEELLSRHLPEADVRRLVAEHAEMRRLLQAASGRPQDARSALSQFAELIERHVRWEERELFPALLAVLSGEALAGVGQELEKRLVLARSEQKQPKPVAT